MAVANALGANAWNPVQMISPAAFLDPETPLQSVTILAKITEGLMDALDPTAPHVFPV